MEEFLVYYLSVGVFVGAFYRIMSGIAARRPIKITQSFSQELENLQKDHFYTELRRHGFKEDQIEDHYKEMLLMRNKIVKAVEQDLNKLSKAPPLHVELVYAVGLILFWPVLVIRNSLLALSVIRRML